MRLRIQPALLALSLTIVCLGVLAILYIAHENRISTPESMIACLPARGATLAYIDVAALRRVGILELAAGSKAVEDLEYKSFVESTGFNYRTDLDSVAGAFSGDTTYLVVKGRFDWKKLSSYARSSGGTCVNGFCREPGSAPNRRISFYALKADTMALAVNPDGYGAGDISPRGRRHVDPLPDQPVWVSVPGTYFKTAQDLPTGTHAFATALAAANKVVFSAGPESDHLLVQMSVVCATPEAASALALQLENVTDLLRKMVALEHQTPNPRDFSGVLTAGSFQRVGPTVFGRWPIQRSFIDTLVEGPLN
ncbi:MAG: hypothetical protein ABI165_00990 [Bryobacteraceae bacterium]